MAVYTLVLMFVLLGFASLTIDIGVMYNTRADLQKAADAAALAGASALVSDTMMKAQMGDDSSYLLSQFTSNTTSLADTLSALNPSFGASATAIESSDIITGWLDIKSSTASIQTGVPLSPYGAVQVVTRRDSGGANGPVTYVFAPSSGGLVGRVLLAR